MSKSKTSKKWLKPLIVAIALAVILFSISLIVYMNFKVIEVSYVDYDFKVKDPNRLGFNADTDALHFGIIGHGMAGTRDLEIISNETALVLIKVLDHDYVTPNRNNFILEPGVLTKVQFLARPPLGTPQGYYKGRIRIVFKRP